MGAWLAVVAAPFIGSFGECLAWRYPAGHPMLIARSQCDSCESVLGYAQLVPVLSWVCQRGRCSHCGAGIPKAHLVAELGAVVVTLWAMTVMPEPLIWPTVALGWTLMALAFMDIYHMILADILVAPLLVGGVLVALSLSQDHALNSLIGAALGGGGALLLRFA